MTNQNITLILDIQYDGTNYSGWQKQPNANTIQNELENAFGRIAGAALTLIAAGRTDAGVHARHMIAHCNLNHILSIPEEKIAIAINSVLPLDIRINSAKYYYGKFHARFDALTREYKYHLISKYDVFKSRYSSYYKYNFDEAKLINSAGIFIRKDDFTTFSKHNPDINNPICDVDISKWEKIDENYYVYNVRANHFLYGMVRSLVGVMLDIARSKRSLEEVQNAILKKNRAHSSPLAPPQGLFFEKSTYPDEFKL